MLHLESLGWNSQWESLWNNTAFHGLLPARVAEESRGLFTLWAASGELRAEVSGKLRHSATTRLDLPVVGDWVAAAVRPHENAATIHHILPRRTRIARKSPGRATDAQPIAANVDTVFLVASLNLDFNPRRLERYLALAWESGARPIVLLTKSDLVADPAPFLLDAESACPGVSIHALSAVSGQGIDALAPYLVPGRTIVLLGSSGAGKSTLINALLGAEVQLTLPVRASDDRGRHATTARQMFQLPSGALLIDTPGMRELALLDSRAGLTRTFDDIQSLASQCRFWDCTHTSEPRCAVQQALDDGSLDPARLESCRKLQRELAFLQRKQNAGLAAAEKQKWKHVHKGMKQLYKRRGH